MVQLSVDEDDIILSHLILGNLKIREVVKGVDVHRPLIAGARNFSYVHD